MSPRKLRLVVDVVRGQKVEPALDQLKFIKKLAGKPVMKLINSAVANAENNFSLVKSNLFIKEIRVDEGPTLKRWLPRAHGRATPLRKKTGHISLVLAEIKESGERKAKKQKLEAPTKMSVRPKEEGELKVGRKEEEKKEEVLSEEAKGKIKPEIKPEGRRGHGKIEGGKKGFVGKLFQRKSG